MPVHSYGVYGLQHPWSQAVKDAYQSMPRTAAGHVVGIQYVPPGQQEALEAEWRTWCKTHDRSLWPQSLLSWIATKRHRK